MIGHSRRSFLKHLGAGIGLLALNPLKMLDSVEPELAASGMSFSGLDPVDLELQTGSLAIARVAQKMLYHQT